MEKIVTKKKDAKDYLIFACLIATGMIILFAAMLINILRSFWLMIAIGVIYLLYVLITSRNIEFEYIVTNGDLDIDKIIAKRKRKRIFSADCKSFEIIAKYSSDDYKREEKDISSRVKAVSSMESEDIYYIKLNHEGKRTIVFFEPEERMLDSFRKYIPKKVLE